MKKLDEVKNQLEAIFENPDAARIVKGGVKIHTKEISPTQFNMLAFSYANKEITIKRSGSGMSIFVPAKME